MSSEAPRVLVVDDDPVIVRLLEVNFRLGGFTVSSALRGEDALLQAIDAPPDAIVCDVMMPGVDGLEVRRRLLEAPGLRDVPFVFLTARAQEDTRQLATALGHVEFVAKPFDPAELVASVRRLIEEARS